MALFGYKPLIIRSYGKCKIKHYDAELDKVVEKEITEKEFLEYKEQWIKQLKTPFIVSDYNDTSKTDNPNVFTYDWKENETEYEKNITKNSVINFAKYIFRNENGSIKKINYVITLINYDVVYLPNEDIYNSFCKWMKEGKK